MQNALEQWYVENNYAYPGDCGNASVYLSGGAVWPTIDPKGVAYTQSCVLGPPTSYSISTTLEVGGGTYAVTNLQ